MNKPVILFNLENNQISEADSQKEAAAILGVDQSTMSRAVTGDRGILTTRGHIVITCYG